MARVRVDVSASKDAIDWQEVHGAARAVLYGIVAGSEPAVAQELHDKGWQQSTMRPAGISPPLFAGAARRRGVYATSGNGSVWFGSPVPQIAAAILRGLAGLRELRWGSTGLVIRGTDLEFAPDHSSGKAEFLTVSPVLVKKDSRYLLPGEEGFEALLTHNIRHKADVLGLPNDVAIEVLDAGPRRVFDVAGAMRFGATVRLRVAADPALLDALYEWGLGLNTVQGFGWIK